MKTYKQIAHAMTTYRDYYFYIDDSGEYTIKDERGRKYFIARMDSMNGKTTYDIMLIFYNDEISDEYKFINYLYGVSGLEDDTQDYADAIAEMIDDYLLK